MTTLSIQPLQSLSPAGETDSMTAAEARSAIQEIKSRWNSLRATVLDLERRRGWEALGYASFRECVLAEFQGSESFLYRQLAAGEIEAEVEPTLPIGTIPERILRPLAKVPEGERKEVWEEAKAAAPDGQPTGPIVAKAVEAVVPPAPKKPLSPVQGRSIVDGVETDDPPDIAEARAKGLIGANVVPTVTETPPRDEDMDDTEDEPADVLASEELMSDEEWISTLPLHAQLDEALRPRFDADALAYRALAEQRRSVAHRVARVIRGKADKGLYAYRTKRWLKTDHPKSWLLCPPTEEGGCGGSGQTLLGRCERCQARGYWSK